LCRLHDRVLDAPLVVDLDEEIHEQLRWCFRGEARHVMRRDPEEAAALALSTPFHLTREAIGRIVQAFALG